MDKYAQLQSLHKKYAASNSCSLKKSATQAVFGIGNVEAEVIFIGEAPGKSEDISCKPFVGAS